MESICKKCTHFNFSKFGNQKLLFGICRRYPPSISDPQYGLSKAERILKVPGFPKVKNDNWCGEFRKQKKEKK